MKGPVFSATYLFVRGRQLEGTYPGDRTTGIWPITALRIGRGWGVVPEEAWKRDGSDWPPQEPPGLDKLASPNRDVRYQRVRSVEECKAVLARAGVPVLGSFLISDLWFNAPNGRIPLESKRSRGTGGHSVLVVGYDDSRGEFKFQNSWGSNWGDRGFGYLPYELFNSTCTEAWVEDLIKMRPRGGTGPLMLSWALREHGGGIFHCRELISCDDRRIGWSFGVERSDVLEIEELFVMPQFRRSGHGGHLLNLMAELADEKSLKLRIWVSHVDSADENFTVIKRMVEKVGLQLSSSPATWAARVAEGR